MRKQTRLVLLPLFVLFLFPASGVKAQRTPQTFQLTSGEVRLFHPVFFNGSFNFAGNGVSLSGILSIGDGYVTPQCVPCGAGQPYTVQATMYSRGSGPAEIYGATRHIFYEYNFNLNGGSITFPSRPRLMPFDIIAPATLTGSLRGYATNPNPGPPPPALFDVPLNMQGTVAVRAYPWDRNSAFYYQLYNGGEITYTFPSP